MTDDLARAFAFLRRGDMRGTDEQAFRFGTAIFTPELPLRYDSNVLYVNRPGEAPASELRAEADRLFAQRGFTHRALVFPDADTGERLAPGFAGWDVHKHLVMLQRREPEGPVDTSLAVEVGEADVRPARAAQTATMPWGRPEVVKQLLDARHMLARWLSVRCFAVRERGTVVSYADLYSAGADAQIEDVATLEAYRGRGYAKAVVLRAVQEARQASAEFICLVADAQDWPKELYRRLGFDEIGSYVKLYRTN